eukprot:404723-Prorocentrum_lima.AAC.1
MTSSLVGSEMCIRDRYWGPFSHSEEVEVEPLPIFGPRVLDPRLCLQVPVSYTHLTLPTICSV